MFASAPTSDHNLGRGADIRLWHFHQLLLGVLGLVSQVSPGVSGYEHVRKTSVALQRKLLGGLLARTEFQNLSLVNHIAPLLLP